MLMVHREIFSLCSESHMKHTNTLLCTMSWIFLGSINGVHEVTTGFRGLITVVNYRTIFQMYCLDLVLNKVNTVVDYCGEVLHHHIFCGSTVCKCDTNFNTGLSPPLKQPRLRPENQAWPESQNGYFGEVKVLLPKWGKQTKFVQTVG